MTKIQILFALFNKRIEKYIVNLIEKRTTATGEKTNNSYLFEKFSFTFVFLKFFLKVTKLYKIGYENALDVQVNYNQFISKKIPKVFSGFNILHLSDLHLCLIPELAEVLRKKIESTDFDICLITGDFHHKTEKDSSKSINLMKTLTPVLQKANYGVYGILGNHDSKEMIPALEEIGIKMICNETIEIVKNDAKIFITGFNYRESYKTLEFFYISNKLNNKELNIFLNHSPRVIYEASFFYDIYLCGHTHGGQICLPNNKPIIIRSRALRKYSSGTWKKGNMLGYTSKGAGSSGVPVRFFCKPEVTVHTLFNE
ncbi:MAG: metallophosphoesterase [Candidatus Cloacimonetes bacterium]|nr:metallophosphoesterase [Candidatus Cloacimonadota bacterium]